MRSAWRPQNLKKICLKISQFLCLNDNYNVTQISQISQIRRQGRCSSFLFLVSRVACKWGRPEASKSEENLAENLSILMFEWFFNQFLNDFEEHRDDFFLNVTQISQISQIRRQGRGSSFLFLVSRVACKWGRPEGLKIFRKSPNSYVWMIFYLIFEWFWAKRPRTYNSKLSNWL